MNSQISFDRLNQLACEFPASIASAYVVYKNLEAALDNLKLQGIIHAKGYWKERKYFCLYFPSRQGKRRVFRYVGCNPKKIIATQDAMRRAIEFDELLAQICHLESFAQQCCDNVADMLVRLRDFEAINPSSTRAR